MINEQHWPSAPLLRCPPGTVANIDPPAPETGVGTRAFRRGATTLPHFPKFLISILTSCFFYSRYPSYCLSNLSQIVYTAQRFFCLFKMVLTEVVWVGYSYFLKEKKKNQGKIWQHRQSHIVGLISASSPPSSHLAGVFNCPNVAPCDKNTHVNTH